MNLSASLFVLGAIQAASAFVVQPQASAPISSSLSSVAPIINSDVGIGARPGPMIDEVESAKKIWEVSNPITVQGSSLKTWSFTTSAINRVQVALKTSGRPLNADVDLWQGPDNTPQKMAIYIEDGNLRPFSAIVETPGCDNAIAIRNTGQMEFPLSAVVEADVEGSMNPRANLVEASQILAAMSAPKIVQGGAVSTFPFAPSVGSVQIQLKTDGRPLNARIELLQGPNNNKQIIELYTEDGSERPFYIVVETPGSGNVVRLINTGTVEFPLSASVEPYLIESGIVDSTDDGDFFMVN